MNTQISPKSVLVSLLLVAAVILSACGPSQADFNAQQTQIAELNAKLTTPTLSNEELQAQLEELQAQLSATPAPTVIPATPTLAPTQPMTFCGQAANLGPWAPSGVGETFEVTCNETNCSGTHVQLWWPAGSHQKWEKKEISVFVPAGLSIDVQNGAGKGWEYPLGCSLAEIQSQIAADNGRRTTDTSFFGVVDIDVLIKTGLVVVRFDRRGQ